MIAPYLHTPSEDNGFARGRRGRAIGHIREAIRFSREVVEDRRR